MSYNNGEKITDYSQIEEDFNRLFCEITSKDLKATVRILGVPEIYKHTKDKEKHAALKRGFLWVPNRIWIREMPVYQMFYELAHEAGHAAKPYFDTVYAEEIKASLFQHIFSQRVKQRNFEWLDNFVLFEAYRRDHIERTYPKYATYYNKAQDLAKKVNNDFAEGTRIISSILDCLR